jgi:hypothetical protein
MNWRETGFVTLNAAALAIFYTMLGVLVSYILYHLFDSFDEKWKKERSLAFKLTDVSLEISILSIIAFWSAHIIELAPPLFPVRKELDTLVDGYISGIFYIFAIFVFVDELTDKLKYLFNEMFGIHFSKYFPGHGSIIDLSLSYTPPTSKTETEKSGLDEPKNGVSSFSNY